MDKFRQQYEAQILEIMNNIVRSELDIVKTGCQLNRKVSIRLTFDGKNKGTRNPFYVISIQTAFSILQNGKTIFSYHRNADNRFIVRKKVKELKNSVVSHASFDTETLRTIIEFTNDYQLHIDYVNQPNHEYTIERHRVPHPRGGRWAFYTVKNDDINALFKMS